MANIKKQLPENVEGADAVELVPGFMIVPTPGHTRGHCALLVRRRFLFTGDHVSWDRSECHLRASKEFCWYSWTEQTRSMARLCDLTFEWVLPGHGQQVRLAAELMRQEVTSLVAKMLAAA